MGPNSAAYAQSSKRAEAPQYFMELQFKVRCRTCDEILKLKIISTPVHSFDLVPFFSYWILRSMSKTIFSWGQRSFSILYKPPLIDESKSHMLPIEIPQDVKTCSFSCASLKSCWDSVAAATCSVRAQHIVSQSFQKHLINVCFKKSTVLY